MTTPITKPKTDRSWLSKLLQSFKYVRDFSPQAETVPKAQVDPNDKRKVGELSLFPPREKWDDWQEWDPKAWPRRKARKYMLVPTVCFNCESACGLLAYVDKETGEVRKFEGNPDHPGSRGRNCAKGPATINQVL